MLSTYIAVGQCLEFLTQFEGFHVNLFGIILKCKKEIVWDEEWVRWCLCPERKLVNRHLREFVSLVKGAQRPGIRPLSDKEMG